MSDSLPRLFGLCWVLRFKLEAVYVFQCPGFHVHCPSSDWQPKPRKPPRVAEHRCAPGALEKLGHILLPGGASYGCLLVRRSIAEGAAPTMYCRKFCRAGSLVCHVITMLLYRYTVWCKRGHGMTLDEYENSGRQLYEELAKLVASLLSEAIGTRGSHRTCRRR